MTLHKVGQMKSAVLADDVKAVTLNFPSSLEECSTLKILGTVISLFDGCKICFKREENVLIPTQSINIYLHIPILHR